MKVYYISTILGINIKSKIKLLRRIFIMYIKYWVVTTVMWDNINA